MGCLGNSKTEDQRNEEKAQREANKKIEKQLQKDKQVYRATHRLLLLGKGPRAASSAAGGGEEGRKAGRRSAGPRAVPLPPARARGGRRERWGPGKRIRGAHPFRGAGGGLQPRRARALGRAGEVGAEAAGPGGVRAPPAGGSGGLHGYGSRSVPGGRDAGPEGEWSLGGRRAAGMPGGGERRARGSRGGKRGRAPRGRPARHELGGPGALPAALGG